jgi:hypothetical protein
LIIEKEVKTMDIHSLLEAFRFLYMIWNIARWLIDQKREKALIAVLEKHNQRLNELEEFVKKLNP